MKSISYRIESANTKEYAYTHNYTLEMRLLKFNAIAQTTFLNYQQTCRVAHTIWDHPRNVYVITLCLAGWLVARLWQKR